MRTSQDVYNQLRWDPRFEPALYALGVLSRRGVMQEVALLDFQPGGDIPWHRIHYIRGPQGKIWDRATGLEQVEPPDAESRAGAEVAERLRVMTWNVCREEQPRRIPWLVEHLQGCIADVIALQEVGPELLDVLRACSWHLCGAHPFRSGDPLLLCAKPPQDSGKFELSAGKWAVWGEFNGVRLVTMHFTSNRQSSAAEKRAGQNAALEAWLANCSSWIALGDFNEELSGVPTFVDGRRLDDVRCSPDWRKDGESIDPVTLSDHFPLTVELSRLSGGKLALAVVPPRELWGPIQAVRGERDPAFSRWPPHINLWFPAPPPTRRVQEALKLMAPGRIRLASLGHFSGRKPVQYWAPDEASTVWLRELRAALGAPEEDWTPHLTLTRDTLPLEMPAELQWEVRSVAVLQGPPYRTLEVLPLQRGAAWNQLLTPLQPCRVVGSALLGDSGDLDVVSQEPPPPGFHWAGSVWRGTLGGKCVELSGDMAAVRDWEALLRRAAGQFLEDALRSSFAEVKLWATERQVYGQRFGYPGGLAWAILTLLYLENSDHPSLQEFCTHWAAWPWPQPVTLGGATSGPFPVGAVSGCLTRAVTVATSQILQAELAGAPLHPSHVIRLEADGDPDELDHRVGQLLRATELRLRPFCSRNQPRWSWRVGVWGAPEPLLALLRARFPEAELEFEPPTAQT